MILSINDINRLCQQYLNVLYHHVPGHLTGDQKKISETYGEILYPSIDKLLSIVPLTEQDVFVDLGSGLGKVVLQIFLKSAVKEACGIEIISALHQQALLVAQKVQGDLPHFFVHERKLTFLLGNFLEIPLTSATVVLIGSPCFTPRSLNDLGRKINKTPSIHTVFTFRPMSHVLHLPFKKAVRVECSWDSALCYIYTRKIN